MRCRSVRARGSYNVSQCIKKGHPRAFAPSSVSPLIHALFLSCSRLLPRKLFHIHFTCWQTLLNFRILKKTLSRMLTPSSVHLHKSMNVSNLYTPLHCIIRACIFIRTRTSLRLFTNTQTILMITFLHLCKHETTGYGLEGWVCSSPIRRKFMTIIMLRYVARRITRGPLVLCVLL